jgi:methenyltetrahydromethanopterin cyclohydrolase
MVAEKELLDISVEVMENGSTVIDAGVRVKGGFAAGKYLNEL